MERLVGKGTRLICHHLQLGLKVPAVIPCRGREGLGCPEEIFLTGLQEAGPEA